MSRPSIWIPPDGLERLRATVAHAWERSPAQRARLEAAGLEPAALAGPEALQRLPVMRKEALGSLQAADHPFGGLLGEEMGRLARIFLSPGEIYDPQGDRPDYWRFREALAAAGFGPGQVVANCFSYHLTPAGFMFDGAARSLGCVVIPAGVGQQEMQIKMMAETGASGYIGLPSYLLALLEKAVAMGRELRLRRALVTGEPLPPALRARLGEFGVEVFQAYGTADLGLVAYECPERQGMHLDDGVLVELCDPDGVPVAAGEVGEVVVTLLEPVYPLIRFGTGDLSALLTEDCPCGRPSLRIKGWMGRANDVVKVRGMFVYPRQIQEALAGFAGQVSRWQAVVERDEHHRDHLLVLLEPHGEGPPPAQVAEAVRAATRLGCEVRLVGPGAIPEGARPLEDRRRWE
ncbi:MAG: phenylacetate--CoA ligase family protein [Bacillota bacterium]